jgi:hypothetical protein
MDNTALMRIFKCQANLLDNIQGRFEIDLLAAGFFQNGCQRFALQPLHDNEVQVIFPVQIDAAHDIRVSQATAFCHFLLQRSKRLVIARQL